MPPLHEITAAAAEGVRQHAAELSVGLPADATRQLAAMAARGIHAISFTPAGGWVVVGRPGASGGGRPDIGYAARGIPDACFVKLGEFVRAGHAIACIAFAPNGGWVVVSDQAYFASGIPDACFEALADAWAAGHRPTCVAFAPAGGWALLAGWHVAGEGLPPACWQHLANWAQRERPALQLAFAPDGAWALMSADRVAHAGLPGACAVHLAQVAQAHTVERLAFTPGGGWAVGSNTALGRWPEDPVCTFEECFRRVNGRWRSLAERLGAQGCGGAGLAVAPGPGGGPSPAARLRLALCYGTLEPGAWQRQVDAWLAGTGPGECAAGGVAFEFDIGEARALLRIDPAGGGEGAAALAEELIEAARRCWRAAAAPTP